MSVAHPLRISYIELKGAEDTELIELIFTGCRRSIRQQGKNHYREEFPEPLTVPAGVLSFSVHRKTWYSPFRPVVKDLQIDVNDILSNSPGQRFNTICSDLDITIGLPSGGISLDMVPAQDNSTPPDTEVPHFATEQLLSQCPRFRVLVIGRTGVGKSTLINRAFGIEQASPEDFRPGKADIEKELISSQNDRFILHDSQGFASGVDCNDADVQAFIVRRKMQQHVEDQLHAVWLCLSTPIEEHGDRLLDYSAETFLKRHTSVLRNIPTVIVFTKYDLLLANMAIQGKADPDAAAKEYLQKHCTDLIARFTEGLNLSYATVSSNPGLANEGYKRLIDLTYEKIGDTFGSHLGTPPTSPVAVVSRRTSPRSRIESSISAGKRRYWMTLTSGASFWEHIAVIHTDIVTVWTFNDPSRYLTGSKFRALMTNLVGTTDAPTRPSLRPSRSATTSPMSECAVARAASARIVQPFKAGPVPVQRALKAYRQLLSVQRKFIAYTVHLVHVLEILFALTTNNSKKLTRGAISLALNVYFQSEMWRNVHLQMKGFNHKVPARDAVFEKIISLVGKSPIEEEDISKALESALPEELERDEEWYVDDDSSERGKRLASLADLVNGMNVQFRREGGMDVLTDIIALQRTILDLLPRWHREHLSSLVNLADFLEERFRIEGSTEDLTQIIVLWRVALELTPPGHQDRVVSLINLANSLHERFEREGGTEDLTTAITLRRAALELTPPGHQRRLTCLADLANSLHERFGKEGGMEHLTEIITLRRAALQLTPPEHPCYPVSLGNLMDYLDERFKRDGGTDDLAEIITLRRAALQLTPPGHQGRLASLVNLSNDLHERFRRVDTLADLDEIITLHRAVLECTSPTPSDRCISLLHLANYLCEKYQRLNVKAELTEAITHACAALLLCPSEHYVSCRNCLANCVELKTRKWLVPAPTLSSAEWMVRNIATETTKAFPLRLLNTRTGILCNRDAQLSCFESSAQYNELLSSILDGSGCEASVRAAVFRFFRYATLSHRWGSSEPLLRDIERKNVYTLEEGEGIAKLQNFCVVALQHDFAWAWSDTCCIDKDSSSELQEAIGSMFSWYRKSALTIVYLSDVYATQSFTKSDWFKRGWTLQELLASPRVLFYKQDWSPYVNSTSPNHKVDSAVLRELREATKIEELHLNDFSPGMSSARSKLQWASERSTTRPEDAAYSLFGIFQVHLPVFYGETVEKALGRLLAEIISQSGDTSVLDWVGQDSSFHSCLPADLKSYKPYQAVSYTQSTPNDPTNCNDVDLEKARQMHSTLAQLSSPRFRTGRRIVLPCVVHRITRVQLLETSPSAPHYGYEIVAPGLATLKLTLSCRLQEDSGKGLPYALIRPRDPKLLDLLAHDDGTRSFLEWLGQPFNALLLEKSHCQEYKRIASDCLISARVEDLASIVVSTECRVLEIV